MSQPESVYCAHCKKEIAYHYDPVNHGKHLLFSILSLGLWVPLWVCVTFAPSKICDECGQPIWSEASASPAPARRN